MRPVPGPPVPIWPDEHQVEYPAEAPDTTANNTSPAKEEKKAANKRRRPRTLLDLQIGRVVLREQWLLTACVCFPTDEDPNQSGLHVPG